jgi:hypothetical protein
MINGAHAIVYSTNADADRDFLKDVLGLPHVDVGGGWLIFGLPPSEVAIHPSDKNDVHELYLMCEDVEALMVEMGKRGLGCTPVQDQGWGLLTHVTLPGGGKLGIYQPRHERPPVVGAALDAVAVGRKAKTAKPAKPAKADKKAAKKANKKAGKKAAKAEKKANRKAARAADKSQRKAAKAARKSKS